MAPKTETTEPWANGSTAPPSSEAARPAGEGVPLATAADVRGIRRWALAGVAAAAVAAALAIAALLDSPAAPGEGDPDRGTEATQIRQALDERLDAGLESLRSDIEGRATTAELRELEQQVKELRRSTSRRSQRVSTRAAATSSEVDELSSEIDALAQRIQTLEQAPSTEPSTEPEAQAGDGGVVAP